MKLNINSVLLLAIIAILLCLALYLLFAYRIIKLGSESLDWFVFLSLSLLSLVSFGLIIALSAIKLLRKLKK